MKYLLSIQLFIIGFTALTAQEINFSQFYNSPQYLNPAFAGDAAYMRFGSAVRHMKPIAGMPVINSLIYYDIKLINYHTGLAVNIFQHTETLKHTKIQVNYSYSFQMSRNSWIKGGLGISFNQRNSGATELKYPDQYDILGFTGVPTAEPELKDNSLFPALTAGIIIHNKHLWISFSGDYLNRPTEKYAGLKTVYPVKLGGAAGYLYPLNKNKSSKRRFSEFGGLKPISSLGPIISYQLQGEFGEYSAGFAFNMQPVFGGIHYRFQHDFRISDALYAHKAICILIGYRQEEFMVAYNYDISLTNTTINRNGAHEISFTLYFSQPKEDHKRHTLVPLPSQLIY